jgi:hypothetical protein
MNSTARRAISWLLTIPAIASPLTLLYAFISSNGYLWQKDPAAGVITIMANVCFLAGVVAIAGCLLAGFPLAAAGNAKKGGPFRFMCVVGLLGYGFFLLTGGVSLLIPWPLPMFLPRLAGAYYLIVAILISFNAGVHVLDENFLPIFKVTSIVASILLLFSFGSLHLAVQALSDRTIDFWAPTIFGAALYLYCFVSFQQWYSKGTWLDRINNPGNG